MAILGIGLGEGPSRVAPQEVRAMRFVNVRERAWGYWGRLAESGLSEAEVPVHAIHTEATAVGAALSLLLAGSEPPPTALLAMSERVGLAAMDWLRIGGWCVP
jgi:DNA-binding LacI/PurR family transcriptional regulator